MKVINIVGTITGETYRLARDMLSDKNKQYVLYINSIGGSVYYALKIRDLLDNRFVKSINVLDECSSSAILLLSSRHYTTARKGSSFLIHSSRTKATVTEVSALKWHKLLSWYNDVFAFKMQKRVDFETFRTLMLDENYFDAQKAKDLKLIDKII